MPKTINILIACYNEEENVIPLSQELTVIMQEKLPNYNYHITFIDNCSTDKTRVNLTELCQKDKHIRAIFNVRNFGHIRSPFYGLQQSTDSDCTILMCADFQDPPEMIVEFVRKWEEGYLIVYGKKTKSKESKLMYLIRKFYYKLIKKNSDIEQIEQFTGFGLYDLSFIKVLSNIDDSYPYMRGLVSELGGKKIAITYTQQKRRNGKTKNNFKSLYDMGMLGITSYTKNFLRLATKFGVLFFGISILGMITTGVLHFLNIISANLNTYLIEGLFAFMSLILFFIGFSGEYIMFINQRSLSRPLVIEEKRLNFDEVTTNDSIDKPDIKTEAKQKLNIK